METVMIATECVCDLTQEILDRYNIPLMYYYVKTEEARFQDTKEMTSDNLIEYIEQDKKRAFSSCASVEEYKEFFSGLLEKTSAEIIHISVARNVSNGYATAVEAAEDMKRIHVIDSGHLSGGMGIMVMMAADMAERGAGCELILAELERMRENVSTSFIVNSTECLYRNGKIGRGVDSLCSIFSLHPILQLQRSHMRPVGVRIGSQKRFAKSYIRWVLKNKEAIMSDVVFLVTAGCSHEFQQFLLEELESRMAWKKVIVNEASATVSCNCGSGTFGVLFMRK